MSVKKIGTVSSWGWGDLHVSRFKSEERVSIRVEARGEVFLVCDNISKFLPKSREQKNSTREGVKGLTQIKPIRVVKSPSSEFSPWAVDPNLSEFYYLYRDNIYRLDREYSENEILLLIMDYEDKERRKFERLRKNFELTQEIEREPRRESIPEEVRIAVWRRDGGKCARCGSREKLEYDHIIPVSRGGSNTVRNIELLCESCNRKKKDNII